MGAKNIFNFSSFIIWYSIGKIYTYTKNESKEITTVINPTPSIPWVMPPMKYTNKIYKKVNVVRLPKIT